MSRRLSKDEIEREMSIMETTDKDWAAKALADHQEAIKPKRQPLQNDFMSKPGRWNGVQGGPQGSKKI